MAEAMPATPQLPAVAQTSGWPPRFWWLKRLGALAVVLLGALAGFHWWLNRHVEARVAAIVEGWRSDPEAPLPEMVLVPRGGPVGEDNAAFHYQSAMTALPLLTQAQRDGWYLAPGRQLPIPPQSVTLVREIVGACQPELDLARKARSLEQIDWNLPAAASMGPGSWTSARDLGLRQTWAMVLAHHDGDIAAAMEFGRDAQHLGTASISRGPCLMTGLVASTIHGMMVNRFMDMSWHRPPGMTPEQELEAWRAAAPEVRAAIADLLDRQTDHQLMTLSWKGERVKLHGGTAAAALWVTGWRAWPSRVLVGPVVNAEIARLLAKLDAIVAAAETGDPARILAASADPAWGTTLAGGITSLASQIMYTPMERPNITFLRGCTQRRAAAVVLAARVYQVDHGRWPDSLEAMVPQYLPHLPVDPFAPGGAPMRFRADTPVPVVYSVGQNMADDGGSTAAPVDASAGDRQRLADRASSFDRQDLVFPLYLPPEAFLPENLDEFNVWNWLLSPEGELQRLQKLERERQQEMQRLPVQGQGEGAPQGTE